MLDLQEEYPLELLFDQELLKVITMMGEVAIPELQCYLFDETRDEIVRFYALLSLEKLGVVHS